MYLIYLDEAGSPKQSDPSNQFVLSAFIIHETQRFRIVSEVRDLKRRYFPDGDPNEIELHMKDLAHHYGVFKRLGLEKEKELIIEIGRLIQRVNCTLITSGIRKREMQDGMEDQVSEIAMKHLFGRISMFLNDQNALLPDRPQFGILLLDSINNLVDNKTRTQIRDMVKNGTGYGRRDYFIDQPLFVDSCEDHLMQIADYVSYCVRRRMMNKEDKNEANRRMYVEITDKLRSKFPEYGRTNIEWDIP